MAVNQIAFLCLVFLSLFLYYLAPKKYQWCVLLALSLVFYYLLGVDNFLYILITAASLTYGTQRMYRLDEKLKRRLAKGSAAKPPSFAQETGTAHRREAARPLGREERKALKNETKSRKRKWLTGMIVLNLGILLLLKYGDFFIDNVNSLAGFFYEKITGNAADTGFGLNHLGLLAPLGISYYTLQSIGYALEVYKGKVKPEKNFFKVLLFVGYYPQMTQGPIGRYPDLAPQLFAGHTFSFDNLALGCQRILWGLFKKAVISNNMKTLVQSIFGSYAEVSGFTLFMGCIYMVLQMYADFSGYTDIVLGISQMYGIRMMENFKRPLFSTSLGEYWRRWHISLSSWFRDYVFYPVSISKGALKFGKFGGRHFSPRVKKVFPVVFAMSVVWVCTGLWHDASWRYILWGAGNGVILIGGVLLEPWFTGAKKRLHINEESWWWKAFCMIRTFLIVSLLKVFPGADTTAESFAILGRILFQFQPELTYQTLFLDANWYNLAFAFAGLLVFLAVSIVEERTDAPIWDWLDKKPAVLRWCIYLGLIAMVGYMGNFDAIVTGGFEYAQF